MSVISERMTVARERGFVVFLIGMRVNKWWQAPLLWAAGSAMGRMLRELAAEPDSGLLSYESYGGRTTLMVQYWESVEQLHAYAHAREKEHVSAWKQWARSWMHSGAIGIWHETYVVEPGSWEAVYVHMPPFGLGRVGPLVPAQGDLRTAKQRLGERRIAASA
ncbi:MAG: DUF4188 domain-containing protein [Deltaproteobacteria bacterium]|nr:MAG: DUF4188 domain-containing protein [Deltaproteobacteria bacterium]